MPVRAASCFEVVCDNADTVPSCDGGWDDGPIHFPTEQDAVDYARTAGFVIVGTTVLCAECSATRDCERLGHQWDTWTDGEHLGVTFKKRHCDHCGIGDFSEEFQQAVLLAEVRDIVNNADQAGHDA
jgi:hypothetical protein